MVSLFLIHFKIILPLYNSLNHASITNEKSINSYINYFHVWHLNCIELNCILLKYLNMLQSFNLATDYFHVWGEFLTL